MGQRVVGRHGADHSRGAGRTTHLLQARPGQGGPPAGGDGSDGWPDASHRVHGVVLVSVLDLPTLRAVSFARASRLTSLTAVTLDFDPRATKSLRQDWLAASLPVELTVLGTPEGAGPHNVVDYVRSLRQTQLADIVIVFIPRVVPTGVWQRFFVRHSEPRIMSDLRLQEGVVIAEVPYQLQPQDED